MGPPTAPQACSAACRPKLQKQEREQHAHITIFHYHCDHLGIPIALTDQTGQVAWAAKLDPWGNVLQEYNPQGIHQVIRPPGQHHDRETGLYYNRHRYYDPVVGSYVNQDPIGLTGGANMSNYPTNPVDWIDPLGLNKMGRGKSGFYGQKPKPPVKPDPTSTGKIAEGWNQTKQKVSDVTDSFAELMNKLSGKDDMQKRTDEAIVCTKQENKETKEVSIPSDIITPDSRGVGLIRPPSPSEIGVGEKCISQRLRVMQSGPLPGLSAPGQ